jgi:glucose/mannose-6-phosphate isomerase
MGEFKNIIKNFPNEIGKIDYVQDLSIGKIRNLDSGGMFQTLSNYGRHIHQAIKKARMATTFPLKAGIKMKIPKHIIILGIGGSAIAGELLKSYLKHMLKDLCPIIEIIRGTEIPIHRIPKKKKHITLLFCCSYSGNTTETLASLERLKDRANIIYAITSGGELERIATERGYELLMLPTEMMPRCAMFYSFFHLFYTMIRFNVLPSESKSLSYATFCDMEFHATLDYSIHNNKNLAVILARCCQGKIPIIYTGAESLEPVNLRWRSQIQENANQMCFGNYFPELNHNEINGWMFPADLLNRFVVISMKDPEDSEELNTAISKSLELLREKGVEVIEVVVAGNTLLERIVRLICIADWTSFYLAIMNNTDPTPIPVIMKLKEK